MAGAKNVAASRIAKELVEKCGVLPKSLPKTKLALEELAASNGTRLLLVTL